jgi:hypothetical protein
MGIKHDCKDDKDKEEEKKKEESVPTMNKMGHLKAGNNSPRKDEEPKKRTDLGHTIAHATGVTHDCNVKEPTKETEKDLKKTPDVKPIKEDEAVFDENKKDQV